MTVVNNAHCSYVNCSVKHMKNVHRKTLHNMAAPGMNAMIKTRQKGKKL